MSAPSSIGKAARTANIAARAVHVRLQPPPRNIYESREVLRVLKDFGHVVMFRNLKYDPVLPVHDTMLAIYQSPEAASKLLKASPLHFTIEPLPVQQGNFTSAASFGISEAMAPSSPSQPDSAPIIPKTREFHLKVDKSFADHQAFIERQSYYWGFSRDQRSFSEEDLAKSVPLEGLATISATPHQLPNRIVKKGLKEIASRRTLRQLWEEGSDQTLPKPVMSAKRSQQDAGDSWE